MKFFKLVLRGFLRFKGKRRHLTVILISGFFFSVFFLSLFGSLLENHRSYWGETLLGSGSIVSRDMEEYRISSPPEIESYFREGRLAGPERELGNSFSPRLRIPIMVTSSDRGIKASTVLFGVEPEQELSITPEIYVTEGEYPESGEREVALTFRGAGSLRAKVGDALHLYTRTTEGAIKSSKARVSGILGYRDLTTVYRPGVPSPLIYAPLELARDLRGVKEGTVSELVIRARSTWQKMEMVEELPEGFKKAGFWSSSPMLATLHLVFSFFRWLIIGIILLIVFVSVYHNMKLMIQERLKEIGVYLTFGANKGWVTLLWSGELTVYLIYCALWGAGLDLLVIGGLNRIGIKSISSQFTVILGGPGLTLKLYPRFFLLPFGVLWLILLLSAAGRIYLGLGDNIASELLENRGRR